jgi:glycosyltransferase involved in cell wall biosynthesis
MKNAIGYFCSSVSWGGLEMNQLRNANWMMQRGHSVFLLCRAGSPLEKAAIEQKVPIITIENHKKYYDFKAGKLLASILDEKLITHLIVRDTRDISIAVIAKRKANHSINLSYFMEMQLGVKKRNLLHTIRFSYFDLWSCPLNWLQKQVLTMTRISPTKIKVIPSGLDLNMYLPEQNKIDARAKLDLPADKIIFGLIGRFDPQKGQVLLLEALSKIENKDICVCLLGEPTKEEGTSFSRLINKTIEDNNLKDRVFIRPFRKDISTFFYAIDAFVMASKAETFGMVTIESMACGTPIIASNAGGSPEILDFGKFGLLFEPLNVDSLAQKMLKFIDHPSMFSSNELIEEAKNYDHTKVCEMVESALDLKHLRI